jgi:hypothetical protein
MWYSGEFNMDMSLCSLVYMSRGRTYRVVHSSGWSWMAVLGFDLLPYITRS